MDVGRIVGLPPIGVTATGTIEEIVAAKPDVLTFHGVFPDEDLYVRVLEAGIDIVSQPVDDPEIPGQLEKYTRVFADSVLMMADCFDLTLDEVTFSYELGACTRDVDLGWYRLPKVSLGGNYRRYQGIVDEAARVETHLEWQMTTFTDPSWNIKGC